MSGTRIRIRINGDVVFQGSVREWASKPPDLFKDQIQPGATPEPHLKGVMVAMADAVILEQDVDIDVLTTDTSWQMKVTQK